MWLGTLFIPHGHYIIIILDNPIDGLFFLKNLLNSALRMNILYVIIYLTVSMQYYYN